MAAGAGPEAPGRETLALLLRRATVTGPEASEQAENCATFRGAKPTDLETILESLGALGLPRAIPGAEGRRWRADQASLKSRVQPRKGCATLPS